MDDLPSRPSSQPLLLARFGRFLRRWNVPLTAAIFFGVYGWIFIRTPERGDWLPCYVQAGQRIQQGELLQRSEPTAYMYPPAMAMIAAPLSGLPPRASVAAWYLVNVAAMCLLFTSAWRLAGGPAFTALSWKWQIVFWITLLLAGRWVVSPLENKQFDVVIAALVTAGSLSLASGHDRKGAAAIGVAAAMKCTPLLFLPYLIWRGRWVASIVLVTAAVGFNLLPDWLWPRVTGDLYVMEWFRFTTHALGEQMPGGWWSDPRLNQSLGGMFRRALGWTLNPGELPTPAVEAAVRWTMYGFAAVLMGITAWQFGRPFRAADALSHRTSVPSGHEQSRTALEAAAIMCLMLLLSPMSGKAHFVILLLPLTLVARETVFGPRGSALMAIALLLSGPLVSKGAVGKEWGDRLLDWGVPTWHVLLGLICLWILLARSNRVISRSGQATGHATLEAPHWRLRSAPLTSSKSATPGRSSSRA